MKALHYATFILLVIGGLNWLAVGLLNTGVDALVGASVAKVIYILVGISAIYQAATHKGDCKACASSAQPMM